MRVGSSKLTVVFFVVSMALLPITAYSSTKVTPGSTCKNVKQKIVYQKKVFTCIQVGKKKVWGKGTAVVAPPKNPSQAPTPTSTPTPTTTVKAEDLRPGLLKAEYVGYHEDDLSWFKSKSPWNTSVVTSIDLQTHQGENFSIQWTGYFIPNETGKWNITSTSDDGSGVWIGESAIDQVPQSIAILSAPGIHGPYTISKQKYFEKGNLYPIRILFGDKTNWAQMTLLMQSPSSPTPIVELQGLVWHSPISTENFSGIDPKFAASVVSKNSDSTGIDLPTVTDPTTFDQIEVCKLKNMYTGGGNGRGFPTSMDRLPTFGKVKGIVLFVEFEDVRGGNDTQRRFDEYTTQFMAFYKAQSYGKLTIEMDYIPRYLTINKNSSVYGMQTHNGGNAWPYIRDALDVADPFVDFSGYDFVVAIPPSNTKNIVYGPAFPLGPGDDQLRTNEKIIRNATVAGTDSMENPKRSFWWLSHEVGHLFGLEHQYTWENITYSSLLLGIWDLMHTGDMAPEFLAWHRFVLGWLDSSNVHCINKDTRFGTESIHFISPIASQDSSNKSVVVRLNDHEAIVLEVRRNLGFDQISSADEGVVAYRVNVRDIGKVQEVMILTNQQYAKGATIAGNLIPGDKIIDSGVEFTILKSTKGGDYIKVKILQP